MAGEQSGGQRPRLIKFRYELETPLAEGPVLDTWRAFDRLREAPVVVKLVRVRYAQDDKAGRRWMQQLQRQRARPLPAAPAVIEAGRDQDQFFVVREYVEGPSLERWMNAAPGRETILELGQELLLVLARWHEARLCHGLLHPGNVIVSPQGPILCDWDITATTWNCFGVWAARRKHGVYLAPEVRERQTACPASDVYSTGVALWEMLSGQRLAPDMTALPALNDLVPDLPAGLGVVVEGMVKPNSDDRYPADQAAAALARLRDRAERQADRTPRQKQRAQARDRREAAVRRPLPWPVTVILVFYRLLFTLLFTGVVTGLTLSGMAYGAYQYERASVPPEVIVPDLIGKATETARSLLEDDFGLGFRISLKQGHPTIPAGGIISTTPEPGRRVRRGRVIEAVVSTGAELVTMPRVVGSSLEEARKTLGLVGLKVGYTQKTSDATVPAGAVISQAIGPGRKVAPGTAVALKISSGRPGSGGNQDDETRPAAAETPAADELQAQVKRVGRVRITVPAGANLTTVRIVVKDESGVERTVYNELHYAGDVIETGVEGVGETVVEVWLNDRKVETKVL